jgi:hypothetical protein
VSVWVFAVSCLGYLTTAAGTVVFVDKGLQSPFIQDPSRQALSAGFEQANTRISGAVAKSLCSEGSVLLATSVQSQPSTALSSYVWASEPTASAVLWGAQLAAADQKAANQRYTAGMDEGSALLSVKQGWSLSRYVSVPTTSQQLHSCCITGLRSRKLSMPAALCTAATWASRHQAHWCNSTKASRGRFM